MFAHESAIQSRFGGRWLYANVFRHAFGSAGKRAAMCVPYNIKRPIIYYSLQKMTRYYIIKLIFS